MAKMMSGSIMDGSLYDDLNDFQKPRIGIFQELKVKRENHLPLLMPESRPFPLSTSEVESLFTSVCSQTTTTTSAPNRFLRNCGPVTAEQEMYAQGFLDALDQLQQRQSKSGFASSHEQLGIHPYNAASSSLSHQLTHSNPLSLASVAPTYVTASMDTIPNFPSTQGAHSTYHVNTSTSAHDGYNFGVMPFGPAAQTHSLDPYASFNVLPNAHGTNSNHSEAAYGQVNPELLRELQSVVPADIRTQEHMKVERKKARNRIAASKCRMRRLQRESELTLKVKALKDHNRELRDQLNELKDQITDLRNAIDEHVQSGCRISDRHHLEPHTKK